MSDAEILFSAHRDRVFRYLCRIVGSRDAGELTQEVFLRVARGPVPGPADEASKRAWVFRIARNLALNRVRDDRVPLETVVPESGACSSTSASFEARYMPNFSRIGRPGAGAGKKPAGATSAEPATRGKDGARSDPTTMSAPSRWMNVDLWLVHRAPGRQEEVLHQEIRAPSDGAEFVFAPLSIGTPLGEAVVQVKGSFGVRADQQLMFVTTRRVSFSAAPERSQTDTVGTGKMSGGMPGPDEVLSYELPPIRIAKSNTALPNQFSVRVKVTPN